MKGMYVHMYTVYVCMYVYVCMHIVRVFAEVRCVLAVNQVVVWFYNLVNFKSAKGCFSHFVFSYFVRL